MATAEAIINSLRNLGMVPDTASLGTRDADLLGHIDDALRETLYPQIAAIRERYFILRERRPMVAGQAKYRLPTRAAWNKLDNLFWFDGDNRQRLDPVASDDLHAYNGSGSDRPVGYIIEGNDVLLIPDDSPSFSGSLELVFFARPGKLVLSTAGRQITSFTANSVTFATAPPASFVVGAKLDIHSQESGAELKSWDLVITDVTNNTITCSDNIDGSVFGSKPAEAGDWVVLAGEAAIPPIPVEWVPLLIRATASRIAESMGDAQQVQVHTGLYDKNTALNVKNAEQRVEQKPIRLGGRGPLAWGRRWYW